MSWRCHKSRKCKCIRCLVLLLLLLLLSLIIYFWSEEILLPNINDVDRYSAIRVSPDFHISPPFSLPQPDGIISTKDLASTKWVDRLAKILKNKKRRTIYLLASDYHAYPSLLNWLVSAYVNTEIDLDFILVLSLDERTYRTLVERDISTVFIKAEEFIRHHYFLSLRREKFLFHRVMRMTLARLISHWGFDVAIFDVDAIPLKDPESLYKTFPDSDIISAHSLREDSSTGDWTMSFGFAFFRSNRMVEYLWEYTSNITQNRWQDQGKLNIVINTHFNAKWSLESRRIQKCKTQMSHLCDITGVTRTGLKITLLSRWAVCRYCGISKLEDYYVWYKQSRTISQVDRQIAAEAGSVWFLRDNWKEIDKKSTSTREFWIHEITDSI